MKNKYEPESSDADQRASYSLGGFANDFSGFATQSQDAVLGDIDQAQQRCGRQVNARLEIAGCFSSLLATYVAAAPDCERNGQTLSTLGGGRVSGRGGPARTSGQRIYQEVCSDILVAGAKTGNCVAVEILRPTTQFNSRMKRCAEPHGML